MNQSVLKMLLTGIVLLAAFPAHSSDFIVDGIWYDVVSEEHNKVAVTSVERHGVRYVIPEDVNYDGNGYKVVAIGKLAECNVDTLIMANSIVSIAEEAFKDSEIKRVVFSDQVKVIWGNTFSGCTSLQSVDLPDGLVFIEGNNAFADCTSLRSVTLSIGLVGDGIFEGCTSLRSVKFRASSNGSGVNSEKRSLNRIADDMFSGCEAIESIEIPEGILEIGESAFEGCNQLSEVSLPDGLVSIGKSAFQENKLKEVVFPESMLYIGDYSFQNFDMVSYISEVVSLNPEPPYCYGFGNSDICAYATLSVPAGSKQKYLSHSSDWHLFSTINEIGQPGAVENIKAADGIKVIAQDGTIHIDGIEECPVYLYDISGRLVKYGISSENLHVDSAGVYLVRVMGEIYKVLVGK